MQGTKAFNVCILHCTAFLILNDKTSSWNGDMLAKTHVYEYAWEGLKYVYRSMIFIISSHLCFLASYVSFNPLVASITSVRSLFLLRFSTFRYSVLCSPYRSIIGVLPPWKCNIWIGCMSIVVSIVPLKSNLLLMIDIKYFRTYNADIDISIDNVIVVISHTRYIILIFTSQQLFHDE